MKTGVLIVEVLAACPILVMCISVVLSMLFHSQRPEAEGRKSFVERFMD